MKTFSDDMIDGPVETVEVDGRKGLHPLSVHTRLRMTDHTLNRDIGALTLWVLPQEDLSTMPGIGHIHTHDPGYPCYPLISDNPEVRNWTQATFALIWDANWYPQFFAKFYKGSIYPDGIRPPRAVVMAGHLHLHRNQWIQLALTWDKAKPDYRLYANGVLIATSNQFAKSLEHQPCGETLYLGDPAFAYGEWEWHEEIPDLPLIDTPQTHELQRVYAGKFPKRLEWEPSKRWTKVVDRPLNREEDLESFYVQGNTGAPTVTDEGLEVHTPMEGGADPSTDQAQVYLWTREVFSGDFALEFEFKPLQHNGLSLLMLQASGMHGEDFMADYPLRTTGSMCMVYGENVRNYHWEYFREMDDTRNDVASSALIKQPWQRPLAYACLDKRLPLNTWHKLQFVQEGAHLRGALNGQLVFDVQDDPFAFTGSYYSKGHLAIRCMIKTWMVYRNLRIYSAPAISGTD